MKNMKQFFLAGAFLLGAFGTACTEEEPPVEVAPVKEEPKEPVIPDYKPVGEYAEIKVAAAQDITKENALEKAKAIEAELDKALGTSAPAEDAGAAKAE